MTRAAEQLDLNYFKKYKLEVDALNQFLDKMEKEHVSIPDGVFLLRNRISNELNRKWDCSVLHVGQCEYCPHNIGAHSDIEVKQPCGQQYCWVDVTCNPEKYR